MRTEDNTDKISLKGAIEVPVWRIVWATEPLRPIDVRMTYEDLKIICDLIEKMREAHENHADE